MKMYSLLLLFFTRNMICIEGPMILGCSEREYHETHLEYMKNLQDDDSKCSASGDNVCYKPEKQSSKCWGYEQGCQQNNTFQYPQCRRDESVRDENAYTHQYWTQAGFGFLKEKIDSINVFCEAENEGDSSLRCSKNMQFCEASNLYIDFNDVEYAAGAGPEFKTDFFKRNGDIGGTCKMVKDNHEEYGEGLQSWFAELRSFTALKKNPFQHNECDEIINKTVIFMKLDVGMNLYHHFLNFLNLYLTQHIIGDFSKDIDIVYWRTSLYNFIDIFKDTWKVFTKNPTRELHSFRGRKVCFKHAVFSLPPRMFPGLYYTMPQLKPNCHGGGILQAFSEHVLHRLQIPKYQYDGKTIKVTLISRKTEYRNILNEDEIVEAMKKIPGLKVTVVHFKYRTYPFLDQLKLIQNTDILIGMHGAGLTHMLFQPNWGAVFEIFNAGDSGCYKDLATLRGLSYYTWEKEELIEKGEIDPNHSGNQKFANFGFDVNELVRLLTRMIEQVKHKRENAAESS